AVPRCDQWDSLADEHRDHVEVEFVDLAGVEERCDELSAAHHPNVLSSIRAQTARARLGGLGCEMDARQTPLWCFSHEDIVRHARIENGRAGMLPHVSNGPVVGAAAEQNGVD